MAQAMSHRCPYDARVAVAKVDFRKVFDTCSLGNVHDAAATCTARVDEAEFLISGHRCVPCAIYLDG